MACNALSELPPSTNAAMLAFVIFRSSMLYALASEGALFYPEVFDLLDKRLRRQKLG